MKRSARNFSLYLIILVSILVVVRTTESTVRITPEQKKQLKEKSLEMFYHAYNAYMNHAYPADELMPLSCKGRYRGTEPSRGDIDDALGNFTLTLIDTLDTLAVLGDLDEFEKAVRNVIKDAQFDADIVVSVFETNIRILGGLLGGHVAASYFKRKKITMLWYHDELLTMAKEVGDRLLPAFNTSTGIPYPRVNLKHGVTPKIINSYKDTCTSCAGTMILEFAALSRLTGISVYEEKARRAMDYLWAQRHRSNNLMGTVINVHNGDWVRRESGVGAGIDSYYEYVLKAYVLLGDGSYLARFNKHYEAVMRYISQGPMLVDVHMHKPTSVAKNFMDSLLAFWPGLQVLVGDIGPAVETHEMLYQVIQRHNFLPEAFTTDFRVHWSQHLLRPEFLESTYFLYQATADPYYLSVGQTVLENLEQHARVNCGFAAIKDVKTSSHEDQMDSFFLAETFKYLYLLFSEKEDVILNLDDFIFTTEAHLLPLTLSVGNYSWKTPPKVRPDIYKFDTMSVAEMAKVADEDTILDDENEDDEERGVCRNYYVSVTEGPGYPHRLRHQLKDLVDKRHPRLQNEPQRLKAVDFVAGNKDHLEILRNMGIRIATMPDGRIQLLHTSSEALSPAYAEAGLQFMQEMIELSKSQKLDSQHEPMYIKLLSDPFSGVVYRAGPAQFGYDLSKNPPILGRLAVARPFKACTEIENGNEIQGRIVIIERGDCMFVDKARNLQSKGALGGIVLDQIQGSSSEMTSLFAMSGDGTNDVTIPMVFLFWMQGRDLFESLNKYPDLLVELTSKPGVPDEGPQVAIPSTCGQTGPSTPVPTQEAQKHVVTTTSEEEPATPSAPTASTPPELGMAAGSPERIFKADHSFYHHDFLDTAARKYYLQAGTKFFHLNVEVSPRREGNSESINDKMKYEPLPDGSKMFTFNLHFRLSSQEKPNLNEMYMDVIHTLEHLTNLEQLEQHQEYRIAIAKFMESAFFSVDRIDEASLEAILHFTRVVKVRHIFPEGEMVFIDKNKHLEVNPGSEIPQPNTDVSEDGTSVSSSHHASKTSVTSGEDIQELGKEKDILDSSEQLQRHQEDHEQEHQQPASSEQQQCGHQADSSSLHSSDTCSPEARTSSQPLEPAPPSPTKQSSTSEESSDPNDIRHKFEESLSRNSEPQSIHQPTIDQSSTSLSSAASSQEPAQEKKEQHSHKVKDEF